MKRNGPAISFVVVLAALVGMSGACAALAGTESSVMKIGEVAFQISCGTSAQKKFNQAVWILLSF